MIYPKDCFQKYGEPEKEHNMIVWDVPTDLEIEFIPKKVYCNKDMVHPLSKAFRALIDTEFVKELKTWDGCFNIRKQRGALSQSLHSWGLAVDLNASWNTLGSIGTLTEGFVKCFTENGFDWGGNFHGRKDPMHFQISSI